MCAPSSVGHGDLANAVTGHSHAAAVTTLCAHLIAHSHITAVTTLCAHPHQWAMATSLALLRDTPMPLLSLSCAHHHQRAMATFRERSEPGWTSGKMLAGKQDIGSIPLQFSSLFKRCSHVRHNRTHLICRVAMRRGTESFRYQAVRSSNQHVQATRSSLNLIYGTTRAATNNPSSSQCIFNNHTNSVQFIASGFAKACSLVCEGGR